MTIVIIMRVPKTLKGLAYLSSAALLVALWQTCELDRDLARFNHLQGTKGWAREDIQGLVGNDIPNSVRRARGAFSPEEFVSPALYAADRGFKRSEVVQLLDSSALAAEALGSGTKEELDGYMERNVALVLQAGFTVDQLDPLRAKQQRLLKMSHLTAAKLAEVEQALCIDSDVVKRLRQDAKVEGCTSSLVIYMALNHI